jgi:hypothetical protein
MKHILIVFALLFSSIQSHAQDCNSAYAPLLEDTKMEVTNYGKKGKIVSIIKSHIYEVDNVVDSTVAKFHSLMVDDEGEEILKSNYVLKCIKGSVWIDMRDMLGDLTKQFEKMDITVEGNFIEYPDNMSVNTKLPDAEMVLSMNSDSPMPIKIRFNMTDRKVEAQETITTAAGTFNCLKLTYNMEAKMGFSRTTRSAIWLSKGVGTVKSESYDKKGNVDFRSELTKFN